MGENSDHPVPITPYEVTANVDLNDPRQFDHSRPKGTASLIDRNPERAPAIVNVNKERDTMGGMLRVVRAQRWPELFYERYSVPWVHDLYDANRPRLEWEEWCRDIVAAGVPGRWESTYGKSGKYLVCLHPAFHRWCVMELVNNPKHGPSYRCVSIFMERAEDDKLPIDLDAERWRHLRSRIGCFRRPTKRDFEIIREYGDRVNKTATKLTEMQTKPQADAYREEQRIEDTRVRDMFDYYYRGTNRAANNNTKTWSNATIKPQMNPRRWFNVQKNGYVVKERISHARLEEMIAEAGEVIGLLLRTDQGLRKSYEPASEIKDFVARCHADDSDLAALIVEGRMRLEVLQALAPSAHDVALADAIAAHAAKKLLGSVAEKRRSEALTLVKTGD